MVLQINPDYVLTLNNLALLRATHPDPKFRDGGEAVILARRAVGLTPGDPDYLGTLAAAYAEAGRFAEAVQTAQGRGVSPCNKATRPWPNLSGPSFGSMKPGSRSAIGSGRRPLVPTSLYGPAGIPAANRALGTSRRITAIIV